VSRRHCLISVHDGYVTVEDLDSVNGTFVNGKRVAGREVLRPGDHLGIGALRFVIEYELTQDALDRLEQVSSGADEEVPEALPLAGDDAPATQAFAITDEDEPLDALPLAEDETELTPPARKGKKKRSDKPPAG